MKNFLLLIMSFMFFSTYAQTGSTDVPDELITNDSTFWKITTLSTVSYVNTTAGPYYNTYKSGGGMIVQFKFKKGNRYEFLLYVQANTYGADTEAWTQTEGHVEFGKDAKGQPVFRTTAEKGTYRVTKNGSTSSRPVPEAELKGKLSNTYLWEKTMLKDDPNNIYLLMIDMDEHPDIDLNNPKSIDPSWVSKFHIPVKN